MARERRLTTAETAEGKLAEYRLRIRAVLDAFGDEAMATWDSDGHVPVAVLSELARAGAFSERWAPGAEGGLPFLLGLSEEVSRRSSGLTVAVIGHSEMFIGALQWLGKSPGQQKLLAEALAGEAAGCFSATEPQGGASLADIRAMAVPRPEGWRLRGCKRYVSNVGAASHVLVLARTEGAGSAEDLSLFIVPVCHPGVRIDGFFAMSGARACDVGQLTIDADLPPDALLGNVGLGLAYASYLLNFERISICGLLLASAESALRLAASYARQRTVGGTRVIDKQVIRHRLGGCQAELWNLQSRLRELTARAREQDRMPSREVAALKLTAGEAAGRIIDACIQVLGARGCTSAFPLEQQWRDARLARIGGGTDEILAELVSSAVDRSDPEYEMLLAAYLAADQPQP